MSLSEFLVWLSFGGGSIAASWLVEKWSWFQNLTSDTKRLVYFLIVLFLNIGGYAVVTYVPKETIDSLSPLFMIISTTFGSVFLGSAYYKNNKKDSGGVG